MYMPVIEEDRCDDCRACAKICPKRVFDIETNGVSVADPQYCTGCESCTAVCPKMALRVEEI